MWRWRLETTKHGEKLTITIFFAGLNVSYSYQKGVFSFTYFDVLSFVMAALVVVALRHSQAHKAVDHSICWLKAIEDTPGFVLVVK